MQRSISVPRTSRPAAIRGHSTWSRLERIPTGFYVGYLLSQPRGSNWSETESGTETRRSSDLESGTEKSKSEEEQEPTMTMMAVSFEEPSPHVSAIEDAFLVDADGDVIIIDAPPLEQSSSTDLVTTVIQNTGTTISFPGPFDLPSPPG
jgi:hypothetical protein